MIRAIILSGLLLLIAAPVFAADLDTKTDKEVSAKEVYEFSEKCAKFAADEFKHIYGSVGYTKTEYGLDNRTYTNNYNAKLNKCFMAVKVQSYLASRDDKEVVLITKSLWDIHKHQELATINIEQRNGLNRTVLDCVVCDKPCQSESEWNASVKPYMEE